jgi:hypothetical protein
VSDRAEAGGAGGERIELRVESVADPSDRDQVTWMRGVRLDPSPQLAKVDGDGRRSPGGKSPHTLQELLTCHDLTRPRHEVGEEVELEPWQVERHPVMVNDTPSRVEADAPVLRARRRRRVARGGRCDLDEVGDDAAYRTAVAAEDPRASEGYGDAVAAVGDLDQHNHRWYRFDAKPSTERQRILVVDLRGRDDDGITARHAVWRRPCSAWCRAR